ncbi:MAG TPA: hypothetical protein VIK72_16050 [Clostridiaceae bacterium]
MKKLLSFELLKKWKTYKIALISVIILQAILMLVSRLTFDNKFDIALGFIMFIYVLTIMLMFCFPLIEIMYRYNKDLSGKQSVLELSIPIISWKKVLAKLIVSVGCIGFFILLALASLILYSAVFGYSSETISSDFISLFNQIIAAPDKFIIGLIYGVFTLASFILTIYFCITLSKVISHKNKIAVPISIGIFIAYNVALWFIAQQINKIPAVSFNLWGSNYSILASVFDIVMFALVFVGTSWLVENKIES